MNAVELVTVFVENKPGQTAHITKILADANVNIRWVTVASIGPFGVMKFLVNDCQLAYEALKHAGHVAKLVEVIAVEVPDQPGGLHSVAKCLAKDQINLDNTSGFVANHRAILIIETAQLPAAYRALEKEKFRLLSSAELLAI